MLHLPGEAGETGRWCARGLPACRPGIPPQPARAGPHLHCAAGFRASRRLARVLDSLVRVSRRVGWVADVAADPGRPGVARARPGGAARSGRTERSPPRSDSGAGGRRARPPNGPPPRERRRPEQKGEGSPPAPPAGPPPPGEGAAAVLSLGPGIRRRSGPGGYNTRRPLARRRATCPPAALPSRPGAGRGAPPRRKCARRGPDAGRAAVPGPPAPPGPAPPRRRGGTEGRRRRGSDGARAGRPWPAGLNPPGRLRGPHPFTS